jgi:dienelactone hydrolase
MGYATLIVDSFTARGVQGGVCSSGAIQPYDRGYDMFSAATVLAKMSNIVPAKIGVFGESHGGNTVPWAIRSDSAQYQSMNPALTAVGGKIAAGVAMYPNCDSAISGTLYSPMFVAIGAADDQSSAAYCKSLTNFPTVASTTVDVSGFGSLVRIIVYPNVTHLFDVVGPTTPYINSSGYRIAYAPYVVADLSSGIKTFFDTYLH